MLSPYSGQFNRQIEFVTEQIRPTSIARQNQNGSLKPQAQKVIQEETQKEDNKTKD